MYPSLGRGLQEGKLDFQIGPSRAKRKPKGFQLIPEGPRGPQAHICWVCGPPSLVSIPWSWSGPWTPGTPLGTMEQNCETWDPVGDHGTELGTFQSTWGPHGTPLQVRRPQRWRARRPTYRRVRGAEPPGMQGSGGRRPPSLVFFNKCRQQYRLPFSST